MRSLHNKVQAELSIALDNTALEITSPDKAFKITNI